MKRILLFSAAVLLTINTFAQSEFDALRFSRYDLTGTARGMAMGSAFGALGGDITGVVTNPAGIAVYRSSEVMTTLNFENVNAKTSISENKFKFNFDNVAYVGYFPTGRDDIMCFNFGFSYNRLKNYDRNYTSKGYNLPGSLSDYMAYSANSSGVFEGNIGMKSGTDTWPFDEGFPWLPIFGYNGYLINPPGSVDNAYTSLLAPGALTNNELHVNEKSSMSSFDFTFGTNIADILSLGLTFNIIDAGYKMYSYYSESYGGGANFILDNWLETNGTGYGLKLGAIVKPVDFLRIGVAYHSPIWFDMTDTYSAQLSHENLYRAGQMTPESGLQGSQNVVIREAKYFSGVLDSGGHIYDYKLQTPYKWVFSLAGIIGTKAIISVDYEYEDYTGMDFSSASSYHVDYSADNEGINRHYKSTSTVKAGIEYRVTPQFSVRGGYAWSESPLDADFKKGYGDYENEASIAGSVTQFTLEGDASYYTFGFGYRFTPQFYMDIAAVLKYQKDELFAYPRVDNDMAFIESTGVTLKNNTFKGLLTVGYKF